MEFKFTKEHAAPLPHLIVHRVNLADQRMVHINPRLKSLVGSKSGISIIDSATKTILIPPGSGVEVDLWVFGKGKIIITHNNPELDRIHEYPTLEEYAEAWQIKRSAEKNLGMPHGIILANLKTHGCEEIFLEKMQNLGIPTTEVILLDEEPPATDRLLRKAINKITYSCVARRVSRIESFDNVALAVHQAELENPVVIFYDPNGCWLPDTYWPFDKMAMEALYAKAPHTLTIVCCPSRWGHPGQIEPLAHRLKECHVKLNHIMTDPGLIKKWQAYL